MEVGQSMQAVSPFSWSAPALAVAGKNAYVSWRGATHLNEGDKPEIGSNLREHVEQLWALWKLR